MILILAVSACFAPAAVSETDPAAPAAGGKPTSLYVSVEKDGNLVTGLGESNFHVREDGQTRRFRLEKPETPAAVTLLVEYSRGSWSWINDIQRGVEGFFEAAPEGHWYSLVTFAEDTRVSVDFTRRKGELLSAFRSLSQPMWDHVETYDAICEVLDKLSRIDRRHVLVFVGSGFDTLSACTMEEVWRKVESTDVVIYCVGAGSMLRGPYEPYLGASARLEVLQAQNFLQTISDKSGGQAWFPRFESAYKDVMRGVMQTFENQYHLVYDSEAPRDGRLHKIEVQAFRVTPDGRENFRVRVRDGRRF